MGRFAFKEGEIYVHEGDHPADDDFIDAAGELLIRLAKAARMAMYSEDPLASSEILESCKELISGPEITIICDAIFNSACATQHFLKEHNRGPKRPGKIYFISRADGLIKIGFSHNPRKRLAQISGAVGQKVWLLGVAEGTQAKESELHAKFKENRVAGEWFKPCQELYRVISEMTGISMESLQRAA